MVLESIRSMIARAAGFLITQQSVDGLWHDFLTLAGEGVDWPTAYVVEALSRAGQTSSALERATDELLARQHPDGGWGYHSGVPTDADSTACVLLMLQALGRDDRPAQRAAQCLLTYQDSFGGCSTYRDAAAIRRFMRLDGHVELRGWCQSHIEVTARVGCALAAAGSAYAGAADKAWQFVRERQHTSGYWDSYWWISPLYATQQAMALAVISQDSKCAQRAADWVSQTHAANDEHDPSEASTFYTALCVRISTSMGQVAPAVDHLVARLAKLQREDGGWDGDADLRIPPPDVLEAGSFKPWRVGGFGTGVIIRDFRGLFTTATCVAALTSLLPSFYRSSR